MQIIYAENQVRLAAGSVVTGHVVSVTRYNEATQQPASLELLFDHVRIGSARGLPCARARSAWSCQQTATLAGRACNRDAGDSV